MRKRARDRERERKFGNNKESKKQQNQKLVRKTKHTHAHTHTRIYSLTATHSLITLRTPPKRMSILRPYTYKVYVTMSHKRSIND